MRLLEHNGEQTVEELAGAIYCELLPVRDPLGAAATAAASWEGRTRIG